MKTIKSILILTCILLFLTNCGGELLKYTIIKEDVSDTPLKTQISITILVEDKENLTEQKLDELLNFLYKEQINKKGFEYHDQPNTVIIWAFDSKEKADAGSGQYIAMISKMYNDTKPKFEMNNVQFKALSLVEHDMWGLTQQQRLDIWHKLILNAWKSQDEADIKYPLDKSGITKADIKSNVEIKEKLVGKYKNEIAEQYKIKLEIVDSISLEGVTNGWSYPEMK